MTQDEVFEIGSSDENADWIKANKEHRRQDLEATDQLLKDYQEQQRKEDLVNKSLPQPDEEDDLDAWLADLTPDELAAMQDELGITEVEGVDKGRLANYRRDTDALKRYLAEEDAWDTLHKDREDHGPI